jgi:hypothetical protein
MAEPGNQGGGQPWQAAEVVKQYSFKPSSILLGLGMAALAFVFGMELAFWRFIFPEDMHWLVRVLGLAAIFASLVAAYFSVKRLLNPRPFIVITRQGLYLDIIFLKKQYFFVPWNMVREVGMRVVRQGPVNTRESALASEASNFEHLALKLDPGLKLPKAQVMTRDLGDDWLGVQIIMLDGSPEEVSAAVLENWRRFSKEQG